MKAKITSKLPSLSKILPEIRSGLSIFLPNIVKESIVNDISRGVSPVEGERFQKYSDSYKEQIRGKALYYTKNGKVYKILAERGEKLNTEPAKYGKSISPVNLKLSGDMLKSAFAYVKKTAQKFTLEIGFNNFLADIHNTQGASKSKVIRRILPKSGETFNRKINRAITEEINKVIKSVVNKFSQ